MTKNSNKETGNRIRELAHPLSIGVALKLTWRAYVSGQTPDIALQPSFSKYLLKMEEET